MNVSEIIGLIKKKNRTIGELFDVAQAIRIEGDKLSCRFGKEKEIQAKRILVNSGEIEEYLASGGSGLALDVTIIQPDEELREKSKPKKTTSAAQLEIEEPIITKLPKIVGGGLEGSADE